jgi:hypothetical protein
MRLGLGHTVTGFQAEPLMASSDSATPKILVLGAGFAGLELCTTLSDAMSDSVEVTLIDESDAFIFGYSKLDVIPLAPLF